MSQGIALKNALHDDMVQGSVTSWNSSHCEFPSKQIFPVKVVIIGAGERGRIYANYALSFPECMKVVGVAEPREVQRRRMAQSHKVSFKYVFDDWRKVFEMDRFADAVIIATPDRIHTAPAIAAAEKGYHILLEKPMAPTEKECRAIVKAVKENGVMMSVCHVLRYANYTRELKKIIDSGLLGEVISIQHLEPVGHWHHAHSFVRGNWKSSEESSPMLLAKSCHDLDWIRYMIGTPCRSVSSFGNLTHFKRDRRPVNAAERCVDCPEEVESACPYSAHRIYNGFREKGITGWPVEVVIDDAEDDLHNALKFGPYGRCVYTCDNDVVDNQVVIMEFEGGKTACFIMTAFTEASARKTRIFGTKSEIEVDGRFIRVFDFLNMSWITMDTVRDERDLRGHEGGDIGVLENFLEAVRENNPSMILTGVDETLESHLIVFAAERSRLERRVIDVKID